MLMDLSQAKSTINNTKEVALLNDIEFAKALVYISLPEQIKNEQQQRSILADTIYYLIQKRLDEVSNCNKLYTLGKLYFALQIPKAFLKV